jgi:hypothetical protein
MASYDPLPAAPGDIPTSAAENALNAELQRLGGVRGSGGLVIRQGAGGLAIARIPADVLDARLTSSANGNGGYSWAEVYHSPPNSWATTGRSGSNSLDPAYERRTGNNTLSAGSKVYTMRRSPTSGAWLFADTPSGPPVCGGTPLTVTVYGCNGLSYPMPGATVQLLQGVTVVASGTTNGSGQVSLGSYSAGGSYTISVTPPGSSPWWSSTPVTTAFNPSNCSPVTKNLNLVSATGYHCCSLCRDPLPATCTVTDSNGTYTATYYPAFGNYQVCYLLPGQTIYSGAGGVCTSMGTGDAVVSYQITCPSSATGPNANKFGLDEQWGVCDNFNPLTKLAGDCSCVGDAIGCPVLSRSDGFSVGFFANSATAPNNCNGSISFTVTGCLVNGTVAVTFP